MQAVFGDQPFLIDLLVKGGKVEGADIVLKNSLQIKSQAEINAL